MFIRPDNFFGNKKRDTIYQLADFYTMFYFSYTPEACREPLPDKWTKG